MRRSLRRLGLSLLWESAERASRRFLPLRAGEDRFVGPPVLLEERAPAHSPNRRDLLKTRASASTPERSGITETTHSRKSSVKRNTMPVAFCQALSIFVALRRFKKRPPEPSQTGGPCNIRCAAIRRNECGGV